MSKLSSIYYLEVSLHHTVQWTYIKNNQYPHMSSNIEQFKKESSNLKPSASRPLSLSLPPSFSLSRLR